MEVLEGCKPPGGEAEGEIEWCQGIQRGLGYWAQALQRR